MIVFPDEPTPGMEIVDHQDDGSVIIWTFNAEQNEWTYLQYVSGSPDNVRIFTDQVLVRDNAEETPAGMLADPSELKTQKDVNHYLNESGGGGGGEELQELEDRLVILEKALLPWVEFTDDNRSCYYNAGSNYVDPSVRMYQYWSTSSSGSWNWAWMVKFPGEEFVDIDDLDQEKADSIGFRGSTTRDGIFLYLYPPDPDDMIELEISLKITDSLEGFETQVGWSDSFFPRPVWQGQGEANVGFSLPGAKQGRGRIRHERS
ncbi:MAG: hypothetical protein CMO47_00615 [Verrucomicrobiales bacterium]|nr:hypothetical protein [Verrucomicrobiales bacterium]